MELLHFSCVYSRNIHFFFKYVRMKTVDHKIFILMSERLWKQDKINTSYRCKYNQNL